MNRFSWPRRAGTERHGGRTLLVYALAVGGVAACTALIAALRALVPGAHLTVLYLLPVLGTASIWGRGPAIVAAVLSFLAYNFSFIEPIFTLTISDPNEWPTLVVFLLTALIAGQLAAALRRRAEEARARAALLADLHALTQDLLADRDQTDLLTLIAERIVTTFGVRECAILLPDAEGRLRVRARAAARDSEAGEATTADVPDAASDGAEAPIGREGTTVFVPLRAGTRRVGAMRLVHNEGDAPDAERRQLLHTFAAGAALAIERGLLAEATARAATLARSDALKSTLLSSVSHELRTPLAAIKGSVSSLLEDEATVRWDPAQRRDFLLTIDEETDRLTRLVANLLDLSRIEAGVLRPQRELCAPDELLWSAVERLDAGTAARVRVEVPDDLPLVSLDPVLMERVVGNLLENALKYSPPAAPVTLTACDGQGQVEIAVADRGPGVPPAERERIFGRFYRADATRAAKGVGLGLTISAALVEAHDGRIRVEDTPGGGARFVITLPSPVAPACPLPRAAAPPTVP